MSGGGGSGVEEPLLSAQEISRRFRIAPETLAEWVRAGKLAPFPAHGDLRRYRESEVLAILANIASVPVSNDGPRRQVGHLQPSSGARGVWQSLRAAQEAVALAMRVAGLATPPVPRAARSGTVAERAGLPDLYRIDSTLRSGNVDFALVSSPSLAVAAPERDVGAMGDLSQSIQVNAYLDTDEPEVARRVFGVLDRLAEAQGYEGPFDEKIVRGSFWRTARARLRAGVTHEEVTSRLAKVERALDLRFTETQQAQVDQVKAGAIGELIANLAEVRAACVLSGAIFLVKFPDAAGEPVILVRSLSAVELRALERHPGIQKNPARAFEDLAATVALITSEPEGVP